MRKTIISTLVGGMFAGLVATAYAVTGTPPTPATGPGLVDGTWLNGLAGGLNELTIFGITATGATSATAIQLTPGFATYQIDTTQTSGGAIALPVCIAGNDIGIINNTSQTLLVVPSQFINTTTATQDTVNGLSKTSSTSASTGVTMAIQSTAEFYCAKNGAWFH